MKYQIRREKTNPNADAWHTLRIGLVLFLLIAVGGWFFDRSTVAIEHVETAE